MNPRLRTALLVIGLITLVILAIFLIPRGLSVYFQAKGGQQIEYVLRFEEGIDELVCEELPAANHEGIKEVETAISNLNRATRLNRNNSQAYYYLGKAYCLAGEIERAKENYLEYTRLRPENPLGFLGLGFVFEKLGDESSSVNAWKSAGISTYELNSRGDEEFNSGKYDEAIHWYERATQVEPGSAESWLHLGETYDALVNYDNALVAYQNAWEINPELSTSALIHSYKRNGQIVLVENLLKQMLENFSNSQDRVIWFHELGSAYLSHGDYDKAADLYTQALIEFPNQPEFHISLGWAIYENGRGVESAKSEFEKAINIDENSAAGYYALGQLLVREEDFTAAQKWFQQAVDIEPDNRWYSIVLGNTYRNAGDLETSIEIYQDVISKNPNYDLAFLEIAWAYYLQNNNAEAINAIEKAIELASTPTEWYFIRAGGIFEQAEDYQSAIRYFHQALAINPNNSTALQALSQLEE